MKGLCAGEENAAVPLKDVAEAVRNWLVLRMQQQAAFEDDSSVSDAELNLSGRLAGPNSRKRRSTDVRRASDGRPTNV